MKSPSGTAADSDKVPNAELCTKAPYSILITCLTCSGLIYIYIYIYDPVVYYITLHILVK